MSRRKKLGLALGGGGARGLAHIGVLRSMERRLIPVDMIAGASIGSLVGAAYAANPNAGELKDKVLEVLGSKGSKSKALKLLGRMQWDENTKTDWLNRVTRIAQKEVFLSLAMFKNSLLSVEDMLATVEAFVPNIDIDQTQIPYAAVAVDLLSDDHIALRRGSLVTAVMASCAVPGFMPPIRWNGKLLVDGGVANPLPAAIAKEIGADIIIGVDVGLSICQPVLIKDGIDAITRVTQIMGRHLSKSGRESADLLIEPAVNQMDWTNFMNYVEIIQQGEIAAESQIENIKNLLSHPFRRRVIKWVQKFRSGRQRKIYSQAVT